MGGKNRLAAVGWRVRARLRHLRRVTIIGPLLDAWALQGVLTQIDGRTGHTRVLGPDDLAPYVRVLTPLADGADMPNAADFDYIVVRQHQIRTLGEQLTAALRTTHRCTYANRRFALFSADPDACVHRSPHLDVV